MPPIDDARYESIESYKELRESLEENLRELKTQPGTFGMDLVLWMSCNVTPFLFLFLFQSNIFWENLGIHWTYCPSKSWLNLSKSSLAHQSQSNKLESTYFITWLHSFEHLTSKFSNLSFGPTRSEFESIWLKPGNNVGLWIQSYWRLVTSISTPDETENVEGLWFLTGIVQGRNGPYCEDPSCHYAATWKFVTCRCRRQWSQECDQVSCFCGWYEGIVAFFSQ